MLQTCAVCQKAAQHRCGGCFKVHYCSKQHQKDDWRSHRKTCRPFKVHEDEEMGRCLVALKDLSPGEVVLQEPPLIWGPSPDSVPVCLGCGKEVGASDSRPCSKCGWPMCGELCERSPGHLPECRYTTQRGNKVTVRNFGVPHPIYSCITVLRCLYQKQFLSKSWKKLDSLESHCEHRKRTTKYESERVSIAEFIRRFFKLGFTDEEILRICGIVMVNSHEVPLTEPPHIAIYGTASMFEHNCAANCTKSFKEDGHILITAARKISAGEHLSICYTDALWGTPGRRMFLNETKFFWCHCSRCSDPTEFGTFFSAIRCTKTDCTGYLLPQSFVVPFENRPLDWFCNKCQSSLPLCQVHDILERIGNDLLDVDKLNPDSCKAFMETYKEYLHKNHYYMVDVTYALSQTLGRNGISDLNEDDLELKVKLCTDLSKLVKTVAPAEKRMLGLLMFELHATSAEMARKQKLNGEKGANLLESKRILGEAVELLRHEPEVLPEGKVYKQAVQNLKDIDVIIDKLKSEIAQSV